MAFQVLKDTLECLDMFQIQLILQPQRTTIEAALDWNRLFDTLVRWRFFKIN